MCRSNIQLDIHVKDKCSMFLRRPLFMGSNNKIRMLEVLRDSELRLRGIPPAPTSKLVFWSRKADGSKNKSFFTTDTAGLNVLLRLLICLPSRLSL